MRKALAILAMVLLLAAPAWAADLQWDYPADWDIIEGYIVYFNEQGETDTPYNKIVLKADLIQDGVAVTYQDMDGQCNMALEQPYDIWITVWNAAGESGPSNTIQDTKEGFSPPGDSLPSGTVIEIPNAAVTIRVP